MKITLFIVKECEVCSRNERILRSFVSFNSSIQIKISDIRNVTNLNIPIVPALFVEDRLFSYGEIDVIKLAKFIEKSAECHSSM